MVKKAVPTEKIIEWDEVAWRLDTEMLSPEARGIYREILGYLYLQNDRSGQVTGTREELARAGRCTTLQADQTIKELAKYSVVDVQERNGIVTLINRRMKREEIARKSCLLRVKKHRSPDVKRPCNASGNAAVTLPPHTPLIRKPDKENPDKALSSLSSLPKGIGDGRSEMADRKTPANSELRTPETGGARLHRALTDPQRALAARWEIVLGLQWTNDAGKWINRLKDPKTFGKTERVLCEVESATKENRVRETPAQYAEQIWKGFT